MKLEAHSRAGDRDGVPVAVPRGMSTSSLHGRATVLVVEDNPITRKVIRLSLAAEGLRVVEAEDAATARAMWNERVPDVVLQDLRLPDGDGFALAQWMRVRSSDTKIVALTGLDDEARVRRAGFDDFLLKPATPDQLVQAVCHQLRAVEGRSARTLVLVVDDDPIQRRLSRICLEQAGFAVGVAPDGPCALEILRTEPVDVVLTDLLMPGMDGLELCANIRAEGCVPVIVASSEDLDRDDREAARAVGASETITRTPTLDEVIDAVRRVTVLPVEPRDAASVSLDHARAIVHRHTLHASLRAQLASRDRMWSALARLLAELGSADRAEHDELARHALTAVLDCIGCPIGMLYEVAADGRLVDSARHGFIPQDGAPWTELIEHATLDGEPRVIGGAAATVSVEQLLVGTGAETAVVLGLVAGPHRIGAIVVGSPNRDVPTDQIALLRLIAPVIAQALELGRAFARVGTAKRRFRGIAEATRDGIVVTDPEGKISYVNPAARALLGETAPLDRTLGDLLPLDGLDAGHLEVARDGRQIPIEVTRSSFEDPPGRVQGLCVLRDLSMRAEMHELARLANHDLLTDLVNRRRFEEELGARLAEARRYDTSGALLVLDLDRFKPINDEHGHAAGDAMLKAVAGTLRATVRMTDIVARLGGDEFAVVLPHTSVEGAATCAAKIIDAIGALRVTFAGVELGVGVSIGIAGFQGNGESVETALAAADSALYDAKRAGRGRFRCFARITR
jgi:diguanylate cyclase (GGDEF)-like protein